MGDQMVTRRHMHGRIAVALADERERVRRNRQVSTIVAFVGGSVCSSALWFAGLRLCGIL